MTFNPPPGWPRPPTGWRPPAGWVPDPSWPAPPPGWQLWLPADGNAAGTVDQPGSAESPPAAEDGGAAIVASRIAQLEAENADLRARLERTGSGADADDFVLLDDERVLQGVGIYRYHHPLENAAAFKIRLNDLSSRIAAMVKARSAIETSNLFTFDNSVSKGRKMTGDLSKLMLRAYNAEADNCIRSLRLGNVVTAKKRLEASRSSIAKLGGLMEMHISDSYHQLRVEEIELTADWLMKKQEEREAAREERARLREERRVQKELADERLRLEKERTHIQGALATLYDTGKVDADLEAKLADIEKAIEQNDYRAANVRAGYVYVISNRGAFGDDVVKIGLTRRLDPLDRVNELSGASVPFRFDVHALFFSEDAVTLEKELHDHFAAVSVNQTNPRKEFFFTSPSDVRHVLEAKLGNLLEFTERAEATEYLRSVKYWPDRTAQRASPAFEA
ncbi:MAG: DUF4041 domain-containing protein [Chloroflexi bacterium]|nr:DUF4041 domain-containing protein [Chloroflexota bacterium]